MTPSVGELIDGRYQIEELIGRGGMGAVWRARHVFTNVRVALKLMQQEYDAVAFERFLAEARAASTIGHPAIVVVSDANRTPTNQLYLAMELLVGKPLRVALPDLSGGDHVKRIGLEVLDALAAAHSHGIIHRDLKPENIFLVAPNHTVKLLDFGIAKVLGVSASTSKDGLLGTIEYMAPEQFVDASNVDARADLWAVAVMLFEMMAGVRPFGGTTPYLKYEALVNDEPAAIADLVPVAPEVSEFFARGLSKDRERRFGRAVDMAAALRALPLTAHARASSAPGPTLGTGDGWQRPPSIPPPVGGSVAVPASIPAPDHLQAPTAGGRQPNYATAPAPVRAPPQPKNKLLLFGIAGAVVVGVLAFGIVTATRGSATPEHGVGPSPPTPDDRCKRVCARLKDCKLAQDSCQADCDRKLMLPDCIEKATGSCTDVAACLWKWTCANPPNGEASCADALQCHQSRCGGRMDNLCLCRCNLAMRPSSGLLMMKLFQCRTNVGEDMQRFQKECMEQYAKPCFADR